nr:hypothetical protein [Tanacetum cinerariifolium]
MSSLFADTHNVVAILEKSDVAEGFKQIIDFLSGSYIHYALTVNPHIYISCIKQFWNTASIKRSDDVTSQWKFLIHTILQSLSAKRTSWNEFSTAMASANQVGDLSTHTIRFISLALTQMVFANMRWVRKEEQVQADDAVDAAVQDNVTEDVTNDGAQFPTHIQQVLDVCFALTRRVENLEHDKAVQKLEIIKLKARVKRLEKGNKVKSSKLRRLRKVGASKRVESSDDTEDVFNQGRMIDDLDKDKGVELVKDADIAETKRRHAAEQAEKQVEIYHLDLDHSSKVLRSNGAGMKKRPQTESEARKNMMIYLKNTTGYKMDFFKGMSYAKICPIFQARFDENMRFLFKLRKEIKEEDQEIIKSINETLAQKVAKRRKLNEEAQEAKDLKKRLEVVDDEDDDVFIEATPLARKVLVVDYDIVLINNKPRFKIIKVDETHQLYISFITLLKNFDREDLENLWGIVKERFSTSKPTNFSDEYLLLTLKTMFEKPDRQDAVWKNQRSVHGLALVKS